MDFVEGGEPPVAMPLEIVDGPDIVGGGREWDDRAWFPPGPQLAICLSGGKQHLADLTDDELLQVAAAARRQTSWAQARELAAIAELTHRRTTAETEVDGDTDPDYRVLSGRESVTDEVAAALTVTGNSAATLVHLAEQLTGPLAATGAALEAGRIDLAKARVICDTTEHLPDQAAGRVQAAALETAATQTTGQLRRRIKRIAQRLAPEAVEERRREAVRQRRLEVWDTPSGTTDLALCDLAAQDAHGIYNKITAAAHGLRTGGDTRPLHLIRADLATQLLHGAPLPDAVRAVLTQASDPAPPPGAAPAQDAAASTSTAIEHAPAGKHHTTAEAGLAIVPGTRKDERAAGTGGGAGTGDPAAVSRRAAPRDHDTAALTGAGAPTGGAAGDAVPPELVAMVHRRLAHLRDRTPATDLPTAINQAIHHITARLAPQRDAQCQGDNERHGRPGYRPPDTLRREVEARHATCVFPTCNQPSHRCDLDHTVPWRPGITCRCNLAPLCRRHHRLKQTPGWKLHHLWPGLLIWTTPAGAWYIIRPDRQ